MCVFDVGVTMRGISQQRVFVYVGMPFACVLTALYPKGGGMGYIRLLFCCL